MRKCLRIVGIALLFIAIGGGLVYGMMHHFYPPPPQATYPKPKDALEAQRQDLDHFATLVGMDRSYSPE